MRAREFWILFLLPLALSGCGRRSAGEVKKREPPAAVESPVKESDLTKVHLTEAAERRLGITLAPVERKSMPLPRIFGGTVSIPQGGSVAITAPLAGTLLTADADLPRPGMQVKNHQTLVKLAPVFAGQEEVLPPSERLSLLKAKADLATSRAEAEGHVRTAEAQLQAARAQLDRADRLRRDKAGSEQAYEEALAAVRKAEAELNAARARMDVLRNILLDMRPESAPALEIKSPIDGIVSSLYVRGGLQIPAAIPLLEISATDPIWVRVPVYVGQLAAIHPGQGATVRLPGSTDPASEVTARQVHGAPAGNPSAATIDLFFELDNAGMTWKTDQKVTVLIPSREPADVLVIPWSAVVHDVHGGAWIYVKSPPHTYTRRRIEVREVVRNLAVLARGPEPGTSVVTAGAAELFGTEFGAGK